MSVIKFIFIDIPGSIFVLILILGVIHHYKDAAKEAFIGQKPQPKTRPAKKSPPRQPVKPKLYVVRDPDETK